jgi:hypothetical protein
VGRRAAAATEYVLVITFVVIPLALLSPLIISIVTAYGARVVWALRSPFG